MFFGTIFMVQFEREIQGVQNTDYHRKGRKHFRNNYKFDKLSQNILIQIIKQSYQKI